MTDVEIANSIKYEKINEISAKLGINDENIENYGKYKAKIDLSIIDEEKSKAAKLILVTSINPTPLGEGKTTTSIGLADALNEVFRE
jgi:formate--tetrahydrofolate ligase